MVYSVNLYFCGFGQTEPRIPIYTEPLLQFCQFDILFPVVFQWKKFDIQFPVVFFQVDLKPLKHSGAD